VSEKATTAEVLMLAAFTAMAFTIGVAFTDCRNDVNRTDVGRETQRCEVAGAELVAGRLSVRFGTPEDSAKSMGRRSAPSPRPAHELDRSGDVAAEARARTRD